MAKVLISYFSDYGEAMYDAISSVLLKNGNDVLRFNINIPDVKMDSWGGKSFLKSIAIINDIKKFKPDVVLNFNHSLPENVYKYLDDDTKICIVDADNPETFWNKKYLLESKDRYIYLGLQSYSKVMYENFLSHSLVEDKNYIYFPPATVVQNENLIQDKNISFIGSNFYPLEVPLGDDFYTKEALELYENFKKDYYYPIEKVSEIKQNWASPEWVYEKVRAYYVGQDRLKYLQCLTDLGLTLYGVRWWNRIAYYDFEIACCFDETKQVSIEDNQWVYNSSKISINISHPQAKSSFSWRVMDIMASNACLLMEDKPDWRNLFAKYLSEETLAYIIYTDRYDMREKAITLLKDNNLRKKCVKELNYAIEKAGRWEHRFLKLEKLLNITLVKAKPTNGKYLYINKGLDIENNSYSPTSVGIFDEILSKKTFILTVKKRWKIFSYSIILAFSQLPFINLLFPKKIRDKILIAIQKYWN